jgi:pimeloyl-ACP methyl ester carboxylesterase
MRIPIEKFPGSNGDRGVVLDAFNLDDVTLVGISLGGCLAIRATAFEPRVRNDHGGLRRSGFRRNTLFSLLAHRRSGDSSY